MKKYRFIILGFIWVNLSQAACPKVTILVDGVVYPGKYISMNNIKKELESISKLVAAKTLSCTNFGNNEENLFPGRDLNKFKYEVTDNNSRESVVVSISNEDELIEANGCIYEFAKPGKKNQYIYLADQEYACHYGEEESHTTMTIQKK